MMGCCEETSLTLSLTESEEEFGCIEVGWWVHYKIPEGDSLVDL